MCDSRRAKFLAPVMAEAYKLEYDEEPQYGKLIFILKSALLNLSCIPDRYFSWFQDHYDGRPISNTKYLNMQSAEIDPESIDENFKCKDLKHF